MQGVIVINFSSFELNNGQDNHNRIDNKLLNNHNVKLRPPFPPDHANKVQDQEWAHYETEIHSWVYVKWV